MCIDYWLIFGEVYGTVYVKTIGGGTLDRWQEAGALIGRQENYRDSHAGELLEELVVESLGNLCGRCRDGVVWANRKGRMGLRQEGRGQGEAPSFALGGTVSSGGEFPHLHLLLSTHPPPQT